MGVISLFLNDYIFANAARWLIEQATLVIIAVLLIIAIKAWIDGQILTVFGTLIIGAILVVFATADTGTLTRLSDVIKTVFGIK